VLSGAVVLRLGERTIDVEADALLRGLPGVPLAITDAVAQQPVFLVDLFATVARTSESILTTHGEKIIRNFVQVMRGVALPGGQGRGTDSQVGP
jgi:hypothetical protein